MRKNRISSEVNGGEELFETLRPSLLSSNNIQSDQNPNRCLGFDSNPETNSRTNTFILREKPTSFTKKARRKLSQGAICLDNLGSQDTLFVTVTVPGSTLESIITFEQYSNYFVKRFIQWIRNQFPAKQKKYYLWCYERQERQALHIHVGVHVPFIYREKFAEALIRCQVRKIFLDISSESGVDLFSFDGGTWKVDPSKPVIEVAWIKTLALLYVSKRRTKHSLVLPDGRTSSPTRWSNVSNDLNQLIKSLSFRREFPISSIEAAWKTIGKLRREIARRFERTHKRKLKFNFLINSFTLGRQGYFAQLPYERVQSAKRQLAADIRARVKEAESSDKVSTQQEMTELYRLFVVVTLGVDGILVMKFSRRFIKQDHSDLRKDH